MARSFRDPLCATSIRKALAAWMSGYTLVHEIEDRHLNGRMDCVLVPRSPMAHCMGVQTGEEKRSFVSDFWLRPRLIGVEIKVTRADFLRGLNGGQFERYRGSCLAGLYVATGRRVVKPGELPSGIGHLVVTSGHGEYHCVCRRHPTYRDVEIPIELLWRLMFKLQEQVTRRQVVQEERHVRAMKRVGDLARKRIFNAIHDFEQSLTGRKTLWRSRDADRLDEWGR